MYRNVIYPIVGMVTLITTPFAYASECAETVSKSDNVPKAILSCLQEIEQENTTLKKQVDDLLAKTPDEGIALPKGAVVAFDLESGCPPSWSDVGTKEADRFAGRTIIVAGPRVDRNNNQTTLKRAFNDQGGSEQHVISINELPPLSFSITVNSVTFSKGDKYDAGGKDYPAVGSSPKDFTTNTIGGGSAFSTISPFISLYYCRKE